MARYTASGTVQNIGIAAISVDTCVLTPSMRLDGMKARPIHDSRSLREVRATASASVALAAGLGIPRVIVPLRPGALSALGALASDVVMDASRTVMLDAAEARAGKLERAFRQMERAARAALKREGFAAARQRHATSVAARYQGQSFELEIEWKSAETIAAAFHRAHLARYGYAQSESAVEIVSARVRSRGLVEKLGRERVERSAGASVVAPHGSASVYFSSTPARAALYTRENLGAGARLKTPCIVTEYSSTTLVPAGARARVDADGNLIIEL